MSDPTLYVPMQLEVLLGDPKDAQFCWMTADYSALATRGDPLPPPFAADGDAPPFQGRCALLHWTLPQAFTHAALKDGQLNFPLVPNRWLVLRFDPSAPSASARMWVVESDYLGQPGEPGASAAAHPQTGAPTTLGRSLTVTEWQQKGSASSLRFLRAVAPGNLAFSSYAPFCRDVFSFVDTELPASGSVSYLVAGWFLNGDDDPLQAVASAKDLATVLNAQGWTLGAEGLPTRTLVHGCVRGIDLAGAPAEPAPLPQVVLADTGVDALAEVLRRKALSAGAAPAGLTTLLTALGYDAIDALDAADSRAQLARSARDHRFSSLPGGTIWRVSPKPGGSSVQPTAAQTAWVNRRLAEANQAQQAWDAAERELEAQRQQLYLRWWRSQQPVSAPVTVGPLPTPSSPGGLDLSGPSAGSATLSGPTTGGMDLSGPSSGGATLSGPATTSPTSGGLNLSGPSGADTTSAPATPAVPEADPELDPSASGTLARRVWEAAWAQRQAAAALPQIAKADAWFGAIPAANGATTLSALGLQLHKEHAPAFRRPVDPVLLIWGMRRSPGAEATGPLPCRVASQLCQPAQGEAAPSLPAPTAGLPDLRGLWTEALLQKPGASGTAPPDFALAGFTQAWAPLFLEWKLRLWPTGGADTPWYYKPADWRFDGEDFAWRGSGVSAQADRVVAGRSPLSAGVVGVLRDRIAKQLDGVPEAQRAGVAQLLDEVAGWDVLSHSLSGLTDALVMRDHHAAQSPPTSAAGLTNPSGSATPAIGDLLADAERPIPLDLSSSNPLLPVRAGVGEVLALRVIDRFGRTHELSQLELFTSPAMAPSLPSALPLQSQSAALGGMFQLPPRLAQAARLRLEWLDADAQDSAGAPLPLDLSASPSPVCGWLLPNHMDGGLDVYDADGALRAEIEPPDRGGAADTRGIQNLTLKALADTLNGWRTDLDKLLSAIDATSWLSDPLGGRRDEGLTQLAGRPLAVVRARVHLELMGPALQDSRRGAATVSWPPLPVEVQIGSAGLLNDGLLGFFTLDDPKTLHVKHLPADATSADFLSPIAPGKLLPVNLPGSVDLLLLVDPRGPVHASAGLLPTARLALPPHTLDALLRRLRLRFRVGPLLSQPSAVALPRAAFGQAGVTFHTDQQHTLPVVEQRRHAGLPTTPRVLHEGWLELGLADDTSS